MIGVITMTIKDIAKKTGYAVSTVSRAMNGHPDVSDEARRKIMECVEEHNFKLNANAKNLKQSRPYAISVIIKGTKNLMFANIVEIIQEQLKDKEVNVHYVEEELDEVLCAEIIANEHCPMGMIFLGGLPNNFRQSFHRIKVPSVLVSLDASNFGFDNLSSVCLDDKEAAKHAVEVLVEHGHKKIGVIAADRKVSGPAEHRVMGVAEAFEKHQILFDANHYEISRFSSGSSYNATMRLLDKNPDLTAIFCMADIMAIGTLRAIYDRNKRVPDDISIMGFDGLDMTRFCVPRISTVKQDVEALAMQSVAILEQAIAGDVTPKHSRIPYTMQEGESIRRMECE